MAKFESDKLVNIRKIVINESIFLGESFLLCPLIHVNFFEVCFDCIVCEFKFMHFVVLQREDNRFRFIN